MGIFSDACPECGHNPEKSFELDRINQLEGQLANERKANEELRNPECPACGETAFHENRESCPLCKGAGRVSTEEREGWLVKDATEAALGQAEAEYRSGIEELREALREVAIVWRPGLLRECSICDGTWTHHDDERHEPRCLLAPREAPADPEATEET